MAACGINEHKEGCRKQRVLDRAAQSRKLMMEGLIPKDVSYQPVTYAEAEEPGYMRKMGSPPEIGGRGCRSSYEREFLDRPMVDIAGHHSPTATDKLRRDCLRAQQLVNYSAKIPNRFSSTNYTQQW